MRTKTILTQLVLIVFALMVALPNHSLGQQQGKEKRSVEQQPRRDSHVIIISIDGLMPECYTGAAARNLKMPNLMQARLNGAYADGVEGVFPTVTYPAHTTMVTGVRPAVHGILFNRIFEEPTAEQTREWYWFAEAIKVDTLWALAKRNGLTTAGVGWPVTAGADIDYLVPEIKDPKEEKPTPKRTLQYSTPGLIPKAVGIGIASDTSVDGRRVAIAEYIIHNYKPNLMLIHLIGLDDAQHKYGPWSTTAKDMAERQDSYLGRIIGAVRESGILDKTTFFIVSDHGFSNVEKKFEPISLLVKEKLITLGPNGRATDWKAAVWGSGGSFAIVLRDPNDKQTAARVMSVFDRVASGDHSPINRVLNEQDLKRLGAAPGAFLMADAAPGYAFGEESVGSTVHDSKDYLGTHGQLPSRVDMRSALVIQGAGARVGARVPLARMIDIAPTAAALLGLSFTNIEGRPITDLLKPGIATPVPPRSK